MSLEQLQPSLLWRWFAQICAIPHPSKHEEQIATYIVDWAKSQGLYVARDRIGNVILRKPATAGLEDCKGVVMQAHLDMVPQKNNATDHNFETDPILPVVDGEWVRATGTTLGADNGIGLATILALFESNDVPHGPLEALLTIDEEAGMTGASQLESGLFEGEILLNTDSEQEGEVYMGCAGGIDASITLPVSWSSAPTGFQALEVRVLGLCGGHSGVDIHIGRGNANKLLARVLTQCAEFDWRLADFTGGTLRNAIPREASAIVFVANDDVEAFQKTVSDFAHVLQQEFAIAEPKLALQQQIVDSDKKLLSQQETQQVLRLITAVPNGVHRMSDDVVGVVETSCNVGVIRTAEDSEVSVKVLLRSLVDSGREELQQMIDSVVRLAGAEVVFDNGYPGWKPDNSSAITQVVRDVYESMYHEQPKIMVIHAGLECGLFKDAYPQWDMVSIGPTIKFPHSPDEKVEIATVTRFWEFVCKILANIPKK